jgi:hypothetical protein
MADHSTIDHTGITGVGSSGAVTSSGLTMATARILGRTTASTGAIEEITVGSGLSLSAGSLTASGGAAGALASARYVRSSADYTMTGAGTTTFAVVDNTNLSLTISTGARRVMVVFQGVGQVNNSAGSLGLDVELDGARLGGSTGGLIFNSFSSASEPTNMSFTYITDTLTAASHTFKLFWVQGNTAHTATLRGNDPTCSFAVVELYA